MLEFVIEPQVPSLNSISYVGDHTFCELSGGQLISAPRNNIANKFSMSYEHDI